MQLEKKIENVNQILSELNGFNPTEFLEFMNDMVQARSTAYYTEEKRNRYLSLNFQDARNFLDTRQSSQRTIKVAMLIGNFKNLRNQGVTSKASNYF